MWRIAPLSLAAIVVSAAFVCSAESHDQVPPQYAVRDDRASLEIVVGKEKAVFRKISPRKYDIDYPEFYLLESEVTNCLYREYLRATNKRKDDTDVLAILKESERKIVIRDEKNGLVDSDGWQVVGEVAITYLRSTSDPVYSVRDKTTIWRNGDYAAGLDDYPVALLTLAEAAAFCEWLSETQSARGLFRLPTWNEWVIAAYGKSRGYPWGDEWEPALAHTSYGISWVDAKSRAEPVRARPKGRTPEGLYGMLGNVSEYLVVGDPINGEYVGLGVRWMGGGFDDGMTFGDKPAKPLPGEDYWGYSHSTDTREDSLGFRVLLDAKKDRNLILHPRVVEQKNNAWRTKFE